MLLTLFVSMAVTAFFGAAISVENAFSDNRGSQRSTMFWCQRLFSTRVAAVILGLGVFISFWTANNLCVVCGLCLTEDIFRFVAALWNRGPTAFICTSVYTASCFGTIRHVQFFGSSCRFVLRFFLLNKPPPPHNCPEGDGAAGSPYIPGCATHCAKVMVIFWRLWGNEWVSRVEFNAPLDTIQVISEAN